MELNKINYSDLNAKAKEMYNFQKVSSVLADYGYTTMWLNNDWQGADFIAIHYKGEITLKIQLKGRITFDKKYVGKNIWICFIDKGNTYLYAHDELMNLIPIFKDSVDRRGGRSINYIPKIHQSSLDKYKI